MVTTEPEAPGRATVAQRWLARLALVAAAAAVLVPLAAIGFRASLALVLETPVRCVVRPAALRVRVPRERPGVPDPKPVMDWNRLRQLALTGPGTGRG
jgi:hypothetical protein